MSFDHLGRPAYIKGTELCAVAVKKQEGNRKTRKPGEVGAFLKSGTSYKGGGRRREVVIDIYLEEVKI